MQAIRDIVAANRRGEPRGIYSVCSAHSLVIEAAIEQAMADGTAVLIEATANQVNQFGGYTGMKPADFVAFVARIAASKNFPMNRVMLGGDHLGPVCWQAEGADAAMAKSEALIAAYVAAGFKKIHLDCSMPCAGDEVPLSDAVIANRAARLCAVAESTARLEFGDSDIVYIIGTEVPPPGGADEEITTIQVTPPDRARLTLETHKKAFEAAGLPSVWTRVVGLVVQPGVEFDHTAVIDYVPEAATALKGLIDTVDNVVFEAHSTDYQAPESYKALVRDHFAILKVGPQLTFALREALFALSYIEDAIIPAGTRSNLRDVCEAAMLREPKNWQRFYEGTPERQALYRRYSYSDRIRYYWPQSDVAEAVEKLFTNLDATTIPLPLISQFMPLEYGEVRAGRLELKAKELVKAKIRQVTATYAEACGLECAWPERKTPVYD